jgi:hypothetical protein
MIQSIPSIFVATPCFGGLVTQRYLYSMIQLMNRGTEAGYAVTLQMLGHESLITRGRNALVAMFLDSPATHLMFIDSDIGFDPLEAEAMLKFNQDVVAGMYPLKVMEWDAAAIRRAKSGEHPSTAPIRFVGVPLAESQREWRGGFVTGEFAGTGFMLIKRGVFERMIEAYPHVHYTASHTSSSAPATQNLYALFDCMIEPETGHYLSEDYTFCKRFRAIGGKIWLNTRSYLTHTGSHDYAASPAPRFPAAVAASTPIAQFPDAA